MAKMGYCDFSEITKFQKQLEQLEKDGRKEMCERCAKKLAASLLSLVIPRTPVGKNVTYINDNGMEETEKNGGTLRRGWTSKSQEEAEMGNEQEIKSFVDSIKVQKSGDNYIIIIENPVMYSSYVEYGHRQTPGRYVPAIGKRLKASWVDGKYMLVKSEQDLKSMQVGMLERELEKFFKEYFGE